jgi:hypothetical protein
LQRQWEGGNDQQLGGNGGIGDDDWKNGVKTERPSAKEYFETIHF